MTRTPAQRELHDLFVADRKEHAAVPVAGTPEYAALRERDAGRRSRAVELLASMKSPTAEDLYHAAWLFNHGDLPEEVHRAHELSLQAAALGLRHARWLVAASFDRWRMYSGQPQRFGTQIVPDGMRYRVWDTDPGTTNAERAAFDVPPLAEQQRRAEEITEEESQPPLDAAPEWLKAAIRRWRTAGDA